MKHNILPLFSSPVYTTYIDVTSRPDWNTVNWTEDGSRDFSTTDYLLDQPEWATIRKLIKDNVSYYFYEILKSAPDIDIDITISWSNRNVFGQYHHEHRHPNSIFSGCLYFDHHDSGIIMKDARYPQIQWAKEGWNLLNSQEWTIKPEPGLLLIWPSYLSHEVVPVVAGGPTRYSIAFNTWIKGQIWQGSQMSHKL